MEYLTQILVISIIFLVPFLWAWAIFDITKSRFKNSEMRLFWFVIVLFFPIIGSIIYFQLKRTFTVSQRNQFQPNFHSR